MDVYVGTASRWSNIRVPRRARHHRAEHWMPNLLGFLRQPNLRLFAPIPAGLLPDVSPTQAGTPTIRIDRRM